MRLLIVVPELKTIEVFSKYYQILTEQDTALPYLYHTKILHHDVDILESGHGIFQLVYKLTKVLAASKYHLALKLVSGTAYKAKHALGDILNIINA